MKPEKSFELNGVQISVGKLYADPYIKEVKSELQAKYGVKLSRKTLEDQMLLACGESRLCRFCVVFEIEERPHTTYYKMTSMNLNHLEDCVDGFKAEILRRKRFLEDKSGILKKIMKSQIKNNGIIENPKELFMSLCNEVELTEYDFYGLPEEESNKSVKAIIKKKFDNLVADLKKEIYEEPESIVLADVEKVEEEEDEDEDKSVENQSGKLKMIQKPAKQKKKARRKKLFS